LSRRALALGAAALTIAGCGSGRSPSPRDELAAYVSRVEPIRLRVNRLLDQADPTLSALGDHRLATPVAQRRLGRLERRFAADAVRIAAVAPVPAALRSAHRVYAHTYVLEDSYLSALVAALPDSSFDNLPHTQTQQRAAITAWRIQLELQAAKLHLPLPPDLQAAGRGEIAPSPTGE
jgi:hypothetical protein